MLKRPKNLTTKLKVCDPDLRLYVIELEKENLKLHKQKAKFHVQIVSQQHEIEGLKKAQPKIIIQPINYAKADDKNKK